MSRFPPLAILFALSLIANSIHAQADTAQPLAQLCLKDWRARNQAALALAPEASKHVEGLIRLARDPKAPKAQPRLPLEEAGYTSDQWNTAVGIGTPRLSEQIRKVLPLPQRLFYSAVAAEKTYDREPCPELDRRMLIPWSSRMLSLWLLGKVQGGARATAAEALLKVTLSTEDDAIVYQCTASLSHLGAPGAQALRRAMGERGERAAPALSKMEELGAEQLWQALQSGDGEEREHALDWIDAKSLRSKPNSEELLRKIYLEGPYGISRSSGGHLLALPKLDLRPFVNALTDANQTVRERAAGMLAVEKKHDTFPADAKTLIERIRDPKTDQKVRSWCIVGLSRIETSRSDQRRIRRFLLGLLDSDGASSIAALEALGNSDKLANFEVLCLLRQFVVFHESRVSSYQAALSLRRLGKLDHLSIHDIEHGLFTTEDQLQTIKIESLVTRGHHALPLLKKAATTSRFFANPPSIRQLIESAAQLGPTAIPELEKWLSVRSLRPIAVAGLLPEIAKGKHLDVLRDALAKGPGREKLSDLICARSLTSPHLREIAWERAQAGDTSFLERLNEIPELQPRVRRLILAQVRSGKENWCYARCLRSQDPKAKWLLPEVAPLLNDTRGSVREFAIEVLGFSEPHTGLTAPLLRFIAKAKDNPKMANAVPSAWNSLRKMGIADAAAERLLRELKLTPRYRNSAAISAQVMMSSRAR